MIHRPMTYLAAWFAAALTTAGLFAAGESSGGAFVLVPGDAGMVLKSPKDRTVLQYMTRKPVGTPLTGNSACCLYPVNSPSDVCVLDFAPADHRYHRGIFLGWHSMTCGDARADFWGWGEMAPTKGRAVVNRAVDAERADAKHARVTVHNDWMLDDRPVIKEKLAISAKETQGVYALDLTFAFVPQVDVTLEPTAFGGLCVKGLHGKKAVYSDPNGDVKLPPPHYLKPETDWPSAPWYDYTVDLNEGKTVGIAVLDHSSNPPTVWHNLGAIAMLNPCIVAKGPVSLKKSVPFVLRYRIVVHDGPTPTQTLNTLSQEFRKT